MSTDDINKNQLINSFSPKLKNLLEDFIIKDNIAYITLKAADKEEAKKNNVFKLECEKKIEKNSSIKKSFVSFIYSEKKFKKIIAITSCKGGVGKSSVATNIAFSLRDEGYKVGLLDADIYGPSIPKILQLNSKPEVNKEKKIMPVNYEDIEVISIGLLIDENKPLVWRGPMQQSAISQLINEVAWNNQDFLIIDLPPGTGDAYLTVSQKLNIDHAVIVTTSEKLAIADTKKGINMLKQLNIPIIGIIENMSYIECLKCNEKYYLFGKNGSEELAKEFNLKLLGKLPFDHNNLSTNADNKIVNKDCKQIFKQIIKNF